MSQKIQISVQVKILAKQGKRLDALKEMNAANPRLSCEDADYILATLEEGAEHCLRAKQIAKELGLNSKKPRIWNAIICNYAHGLRCTSRFDEAEKAQLESTRSREKLKDPQLHECYHKLGILYLAKKDFEKSKRNFERALTLR